jgi:hypothetical protein
LCFANHNNNILVIIVVTVTGLPEALVALFHVILVLQVAPMLPVARGALAFRLPLVGRADVGRRTFGPRSVVCVGAREAGRVVVEQRRCRVVLDVRCRRRRRRRRIVVIVIRRRRRRAILMILAALRRLEAPRVARRRRRRRRVDEIVQSSMHLRLGHRVVLLDARHAVPIVLVAKVQIVVVLRHLLAVVALRVAVDLVAVVVMHAAPMATIRVRDELGQRRRRAKLVRRRLLVVVALQTSRQRHARRANGARIALIGGVLDPRRATIAAIEDPLGEIVLRRRALLVAVVGAHLRREHTAFDGQLGQLGVGGEARRRPSDVEEDAVMADLDRRAVVADHPEAGGGVAILDVEAHAGREALGGARGVVDRQLGPQRRLLDQRHAGDRARRRGGTGAQRWRAMTLVALQQHVVEQLASRRTLVVERHQSEEGAVAAKRDVVLGERVGAAEVEQAGAGQLVGRRGAARELLQRQHADIGDGDAQQLMQVALAAAGRCAAAGVERRVVVAGKRQRELAARQRLAQAGAIELAAIHLAAEQRARAKVVGAELAHKARGAVAAAHAAHVVARVAARHAGAIGARGAVALAHVAHVVLRRAVRHAGAVLARGRVAAAHVARIVRGAAQRRAGAIATRRAVAAAHAAHVLRRTRKVDAQELRVVRHKVLANAVVLKRAGKRAQLQRPRRRRHYWHAQFGAQRVELGNSPLEIGLADRRQRILIDRRVWQHTYRERERQL